MRVSKLIFSVALSLIFLYLAAYSPHLGEWFRGNTSLGDALFGHARFNLSELGRVLSNAHWIPIIWAGVLFFLALIVRAWRWQLILEPIKPMRFRDVFSAMSIGYLANNILPFRMGEVYRAHVVYQISGMSRSAAFGSIVLERVIDLFSMMPYMILAFLLIPLPGAMRISAMFVGIFSIVVMAFLVWMAISRDQAMAIVRRLFSILPARIAAALIRLVERFTSGLSSLGTMRHILPMVFSSLALWAMYAGMSALALKSLDLMGGGIELIDKDPLGAVLVLMVVTTVGFVIPGAPGAVGTYHGVAVLGLSLFGVPGDRAAGFAILLHALNYIPLTIMGFVFFWKLGLHFGQTGQQETDDRISTADGPAPAEEA